MCREYNSILLKRYCKQYTNIAQCLIVTINYVRKLRDLLTLNVFQAQTKHTERDVKVRHLSLDVLVIIIMIFISMITHVQLVSHFK